MITYWSMVSCCGCGAMWIDSVCAAKGKKETYELFRICMCIKFVVANTMFP